MRYVRCLFGCFISFYILHTYIHVICLLSIYYAVSHYILDGLRLHLGWATGAFLRRTTSRGGRREPSQSRQSLGLRVKEWKCQLVVSNSTSYQLVDLDYFNCDWIISIVC
jgi:hypothetical protein